MTRGIVLVGLVSCVTVEREVPRGADAGADAAPVCPGAPVAAPRLLAPWNGAATGGGHVRPRFRWLAETLADGTAARYEIQIDDSCGAGGHATCEMPSPEADASDVEEAEWTPAADLAVSDVAPVGRRYAWRVRACDPCSGSCGPWSAGRYVDVGREAGDVNGDGYADLVVGAWGKDAADGLHANAGEVTLFLGGSGPLAPSAQALAPPTIQVEGRFGFATAMAGDLNADGFGDFAVGAYQLNAPEADEGFAWVYYGSAAGVGTVQGIDNPRDGATGAYGVSVTGAGDVDDDGFADLVVGADGQTITLASEGAAYLHRGGPAGVGVWPAVEIASPAAQAVGIFARHVSGVGDVDGDGRSDVVVGAEWADDVAADQGAAYFYSGLDGLEDGPIAFVNPTPEENGGFGYAISGAGDTDGDGYGDLVVGACRANGPAGESDVGIAYFFRGGPDGPSPEPFATLPNPTFDVGALFGYAIAAAGDVNADGFDDVLVGAIWSSPADLGLAGEAFLFPGGPSGLDATSWTILAPPIAAAGLQFGAAVAGPGDLDGDGVADVVVGASGFDGALADEGAVDVFLGDAAGIGASVEELVGTQAASQFGASIARVGGR